MRILITSQPGMGHLNGLLALGRVMQARGATVFVAGAPSVAGQAQSAGLDGVAVAPEPEGSDSASNRALLKSGASSGERLAVLRSEVSIRSRAFALLDGLRRMIGRARPDLVIRDSTELAGWVVAEACDVPHVSFEVSAHWGVERWNATCGDAIGQLRDAAGLDTDPESPAAGLFEYLHISNCPPSLLGAGDPMPPNTHTVQPQFYESSTSNHSLSSVEHGERHIYAAFGSVYRPEERQYFAFLRECSRFAPIFAVTQRSWSAMERLRQAPYIPQTPLMPGCNLVICHGGRSTVLTALRFGVPVLCLPLGSDHQDVARVVRDAGAGAVASWGDTVAELVEIARRAYGDEAMRTAARSIAAEIARMPEIDLLVDDLQQQFA